MKRIPSGRRGQLRLHPKTFLGYRIQNHVPSLARGERDSVHYSMPTPSRLDGTLHLYEATLQAKYLEQAVALADRMIELFYDQENGGFGKAPATPVSSCASRKTTMVHAFGQFRSLIGLLKLHKITERKKYRTCAERTLKLFAERMEKSGGAVPYLLQALDFYLHEPYRVVVAGNPEDPAFQKALHEVHKQYQPNRVLMAITAPWNRLPKSKRPRKTARHWSTSALEPPAKSPPRSQGIPDPPSARTTSHAGC